MGNNLFNIAYICYTASTALYLAYLLTKRESFSRWAYGILLAALAIHVVSVVDRTFTIRSQYLAQAELLQQQGQAEAARIVEHTAHAYVPWSNWFESFSFFGAIIAGLFAGITASISIPLLGAFILPISWGLLTVAFFSNRTVQPLLPSLQSHWMAIHVPIMFTSYAILGVAFAVGIAYLLEERQMKSKRPADLSYRLPSLEEMDTLIFRLIMIALPLLTLGIFIGGLWAHAAWGRFWGWDPKEIWALLTWFIYAIYLHLRLVAGWRGRKTAYLSLAGFALVLFTYVGVSSPLHGFLSRVR